MASPGAIGHKIRTPAANWVLDYAGFAFHGSLLGTVLEVKFTDNLGGLSGELEIQIEDNLKQWQGAMFPNFGDNIYLQIGYEGEHQLPAGFFQIDEVELEGPPDIIHISALPAPITTALRTRNTVGFENSTLRAVASTIAAKHGFTLIFKETDVDVSFARVTQFIG
jgi:uncharacterized protein